MTKPNDRLAAWITASLLGALYVDLVRHNFQKQGSCDNGRHEIKSAAPFGLTIWGWGSSETGAFNTTDVSYAYPAGAAVQPINDVVVLPVPK